jgi:hypothetical protein
MMMMRRRKRKRRRKKGSSCSERHYIFYGEREMYDSLGSQAESVHSSGGDNVEVGK